jgi:ATPase subunit of ABC transporter with duplicated ATPase domains
MEEVATRIRHFDGKGIEDFKGAYEEYQTTTAIRQSQVESRSRAKDFMIADSSFASARGTRDISIRAQSTSSGSRGRNANNFKREASQRDVDGNTALSLDQQHAVFPRRAGGIRNSTAISGSKNRNDEIFFVPENAEKRHVDVASKARPPHRRSALAGG